ncbi:MAG: hypothetical protein HQK72_13135 [Desulfamplus sp.]|nr:hypothetical protein [Desulfamplus sp.]
MALIKSPPRLRLTSAPNHNLEKEAIDIAIHKTAEIIFSRSSFRRISVLGQGFDKKLVNDEILAMFF